MSTDSSPRPESREPEPESTSGAGTPQRANGDPVIIDGISYIPSTSLLTRIPKLSFKDDRAFGVVDTRGEAPRMYSPGSELGFYFNDTRYLAIWETTFNGTAPIALANELRYGGSTIVYSMTNKDMVDLETKA